MLPAAINWVDFNNKYVCGWCRSQPNRIRRVNMSIVTNTNSCLMMVCVGRHVNTETNQPTHSHHQQPPITNGSPHQQQQQQQRNDAWRVDMLRYCDEFCKHLYACCAIPCSTLYVFVQSANKLSGYAFAVLVSTAVCSCLCIHFRWNIGI